MLLLLSGAGEHQHHDGYQIRKHLDDLLLASRKAGDIYAGDIKTAEYVGAEDSGAGLPQSEDNDSDSKPTSVTEAVICPGAGGVVHYEVKTSETRDSTAEAGSDILILSYVDACRVCCSRVLTHCTQIQSDLCLLQHKLCQQSYEDS